jgi:hypothetical protein
MGMPLWEPGMVLLTLIRPIPLDGVFGNAM